MSANDDLEEQRKKLDEQFKYLYQREQDLDDRIKEFDIQRIRVKQLKDEMNGK